MKHILGKICQGITSIWRILRLLCHRNLLFSFDHLEPSTQLLFPDFVLFWSNDMIFGLMILELLKFICTVHELQFLSCSSWKTSSDKRRLCLGCWFHLPWSLHCWCWISWLEDLPYECEFQYLIVYDAVKCHLEWWNQHNFNQKYDAYFGW